MISTFTLGGINVKNVKKIQARLPFVSNLAVIDLIYKYEDVSVVVDRGKKKKNRK